MTNNNHEPGEVGKLSIQCVQDSMRWFGDTDVSLHAVQHHALALAGEVGEFCNIVKKIDRGSLEFGNSQTQYDLAMELTDVFIYTLNLAGLLKIDLAQAYRIKRAQNEERFMKERKVREERRGKSA
jgi:NTP pyrophosphatase (non-canonical NTP hydrolase)